MDHRTTTMAVVARKRKRRRQVVPPKWSVVRGMLHMTLNDAAAKLDVPASTLRHLCHQNGYPTWPGKTIRYMKRTGLIVEVDAPEGSPWAGLAGPSQVAKVAKSMKKKPKVTGIHEPVADHPPKELVTLNLIDKVGSSSSSKSN